MRRSGPPARRAAGADAIPVNLTLPAGPAGRGGRGRRPGRARRLLLLQGQGRPAGRRRARGRGARGRGLVAGAAGRRQRRLERRRRRWRRSRRWRGHDLQLVEQPCAHPRGAGDVRAAVDVPVAADESIAGAADVRAAAALGACDAVNVKLAGSGGFGPARDALRAAREEALEPGCRARSTAPGAIAAALQLAAGERLALACGLATLELFDAQMARSLPAPDSGPDGRAAGARPRRGGVRRRSGRSAGRGSRLAAPPPPPGAGAAARGPRPPRSRLARRGTARAIRRASSE